MRWSAWNQAEDPDTKADYTHTQAVVTVRHGAYAVCPSSWQAGEGSSSVVSSGVVGEVLWVTKMSHWEFGSSCGHLGL